jgi:hypothetical protein
MFHHKHESKLSIFIKHSLFWVGLIVIVLTFISLSKRSDIKIPQREITVKINLDNKINICLPDEQ